MNAYGRLILLAVAGLSACSLDLSQKTGCKTTDDCVAGSVCVSNRCVSRDGGAGDVSTIGISEPGDGRADDAEASDGWPDGDASNSEASLPEPADGSVDESDGPTDGAADGPDGPPTPPVLPQTVLWLDAAKGFSVTGSPPVAEWLDQSGNENHARQDVSTSIPTLTQNVAGGLPAITFDGQTTFLSVADSLSLRFGTGDYAVVVVARSTNSSAERFPVLFWKVESEYPNRGPGLLLHTYLGSPGGQVGARDDDNLVVMSTRPYNDSQFHLFLMRRTGTTLSLRIDAETIGWIAETPTVNADAPGRPVMIGHNGYDPSAGNQALEGDIAELIAIRGPVGEAPLRELEAALMGKYGLRPAPEAAALLPSAADDLVLWLDAESGVTSGPSAFAWSDRSGLGNDAVAPPGSGVPQLVQAWPDLPAAVGFSGDNEYLQLPPGMNDFTRGLSAFIVVEPQAPLTGSDSQSTRFIDFGNPPGELYSVVIEREGLQGNALTYAVCDPYSSCYGGGLAADVVHSYTRQLLEVHAPGGGPGAGIIFQYFKNGVTAGYGYGMVPLVVNRESVLIGRSNYAPNGQIDPPDLRGYLAEIVLYNRLLGEDERRGVERYLLDHWKLR